MEGEKRENTRLGRREGREYKIGKERRERIQDWEEDKEDNTRLGRREGGEKKIGKWGGETNCSARC